MMGWVHAWSRELSLIAGCCLELFEVVVGTALGSLLVELQNVDHSLWILPSLLLRDTALVDQTLPLFRKSLLALVKIDSLGNMRHTVNWPVELS